MRPSKHAMEKAIQDVCDAMKGADLANIVFEGIFGTPDDRQDYEQTEIKAMREDE